MNANVDHPVIEEVLSTLIENQERLLEVSLYLKERVETLETVVAGLMDVSLSQKEFTSE